MSAIMMPKAEHPAEMIRQAEAAERALCRWVEAKLVALQGQGLNLDLKIHIRGGTITCKREPAVASGSTKGM